MAAQFRYWLELLDADTRHGGALFARMLPLAAFGPGYWRNTTLEANEELVALLARRVPPDTRRQTEVDLSVDLTDALGRIGAGIRHRGRPVRGDLRRTRRSGRRRGRFRRPPHAFLDEQPSGGADEVAAHLREAPIA